VTGGKRLRGAEAVVRALEDEGIPFTFGIPGTHNIELYDRLGESELVHAILVTDEQSASFMADGLWRASGRLGCVSVVPGAGLTHAMSGIAEAYLDHIPMLVLGCGIRRDTGHAFQLHDVDQLAMVAPVTKGVFRPGRGDEIYSTIRGACALARSGAPGPVMVEIPASLYMRPDHAPPGADPVVGPAARPAPSPTSDDVKAVANLLAHAHRPLLYLGAGAAAAGLDLVTLAELLESPVATTLQGKGVFPERATLRWRSAADLPRSVRAATVCSRRDRSYTSTSTPPRSERTSRPRSDSWPTPVSWLPLWSRRCGPGAGPAPALLVRTSGRPSARDARESVASSDRPRERDE